MGLSPEIWVSCVCGAECGIFLSGKMGEKEELEGD